jgi:hypothetical protein
MASEARFGSGPASARPKAPPSMLRRLFGVIADPRAWGAWLYMLLALITGIFYGMWVLLGSSVALISLVFIFGLPVTGAFLLSVRGIALMEGRMVEALLGVRMPRRPLFIQEKLGWVGKFKALISERLTWKALAYLVLQWPLGSLYATVAFTLFGVALKFAVYPLWYALLNRPLLTIVHPYYPPLWMIPLISLAGFLLLPLVLHLARWVGRIHGRYAKAMLVRKSDARGYPERRGPQEGGESC